MPPRAAGWFWLGGLWSAVRDLVDVAEQAWVQWLEFDWPFA